MQGGFYYDMFLGHPGLPGIRVWCVGSALLKELLKGFVVVTTHCSIYDVS